MKKKFLLTFSAFLTLLAGSGTAWGQYGVLSPENQEHEHSECCICGGNHSSSANVSLQPVELPKPQRKSVNSITPRRGDGTGSIGYISNPGNVNNEFGAGESATIYNDGSSKVTEELSGGSGHLLNNSPISTIQLGSTKSKNVVLHSYNSDGFAMGWISVYRVGVNSPSGDDALYWYGIHNTPTNPIDLKSPEPVVFNSGSYSIYSFNTTNFTSEVFKASCCNANTFNATLYTNPSDGRVGLILGHHTPASAPTYTYYPDSLSPSLLYTTTKGDSTVSKTYGGIVQSVGTDDDVALVQTTGYPVFSYANLANDWEPRESAIGKDFANTDSAYLDNYRRPTTVAVEGTNKFENIIFEDINWWYNTYKATAPTAWADVMDPSDPEFRDLYDGGYIYDMSDTYPYVGSAYQGRWRCCSGTKTLREYTVEWKPKATNQGKTLLDAAVQLMDGSETCVTNDVNDKTNNINEAPSVDSVSKSRVNTNALIIVPFTDRFTLRTTGEFHANLDNERDSLTSRRILYKQTSFPDPDPQVYLMPSAGNSTTYKSTYSLVAYDNSGSINTPAPYNQTKASLFGVYGAYDFDGLMANIHTLSSHDGNTPSITHPSKTTMPGTTAVGDNNHGVIEVGSGFAQGSVSGKTGYDKFHIYSGGTVKNFEGQCNGPSDNFEMNFTTSDNTPVFYLDADEPTYILNFGNNGHSYWNADINFKTDGIANLKTAFNTAQGNGAMHIQARGDVKFLDKFDPTVIKKNELRLLSDQGSVQLIDEFLYTNNADSNLILWAKGQMQSSDINYRSCVADTTKNGSGVVFFKKNVDIKQNGSGVSLIRSEHDDVLMEGTFGYTNQKGANNGELIMQAGQDIYGQDDIMIEQTGGKAILLEAKNSIHTKGNVSFDRTSAEKGDITLKAGYNTFNTSADPDVAKWTAGICSGNDYSHRNPCSSAPGSDIWFEGGAKTVTFTIPTNHTFNTTMRAYNSIYVDPNFVYNNAGDNVDAASVRVNNHLLMFAETGNIEAIQNPGTKMEIEMTNKLNTTSIQLQAGNTVGSYCVAGPVCNPAKPAFDGNILFNKVFNIDHNALGTTLISAERDIENQISGPMTFTYGNPALDANFDMTAGRHIETHAAVTFDYANASISTTADITMEAGRLNDAKVCADNLCKVHEYGSTLTESDNVTPYNPGSHTNDNDFSADGDGQGSILLFAPLNFIYEGKGNILMTALNGDIESDPYLHGDYKALTGAPIKIDHNNGSGKTTLEAIDIRLHDVFIYDATTGSTDKNNGNLTFHAFDSILTRNISYTNLTDNGSVYVTADKYKSAACAGSIMQGHIVLGYGADKDNKLDTVLFDFGGSGNTSASGANLYIKAGYDGFAKHPDKKGKYGGNITYDHMIVNAASGNRKIAGYTEISTPNGNIWGKDSITYSGWNGDLLVDAGMGSKDDLDAIAWKNDDNHGINTNILNTNVPNICATDSEWRTGNIMMKGGSLDFNATGTGNATFRTREGYIDTYDAFNVFNMKGQLLKYAHAEDATTAAANQFGDISERDFTYTPAGGSVYYGADDNIMFNYGNSNNTQYYTNSLAYCTVSGNYDYANSKNGLHTTAAANPYYNTTYGSKFNAEAAVFNVNTNGYLFYKNMEPVMNYHFLYRGGDASCNPNAGLTGSCATYPNGASDITMDFSQPNAGGFATVANNYIDFFTKFTYMGGSGSGMPNPTVGNLLYESVAGYGLYLKSRNQGVTPEKRRVTCHGCGDSDEWPVLTFHDDARVHMEGQKVLLEAPVIDFFGHAELDATSKATNNSRFIVKADSLIFHDSAIFDGTRLQLLPFTATDRHSSAELQKRLGVMNDINYKTYIEAYGPAIVMEDREMPVLELGYQRCNEPMNAPNEAKNVEDVAHVGGDVIVAVKHGYELPILNTVVANHARISFIDDMIDGPGNTYYDANVRTDLLRIRNKVEFYTDPTAPTFRKGTFKMTSDDQMLTQRDAGIYMRHLHMEPGSELSIPGEDSLTVIATTTVGGYGHIHENVTVKANGTIAPGYASFMEYDCTSGKKQGKLTIHNLHMEKDAELRVSISGSNCQKNPSTGLLDYNCTQMDTLHVKDSLHFEGKIPLYVLTEDKTIAPGCYLFMIYDDLDGTSKERVRNLELVIDRYEDSFFYLNFSTPGEVWLCVSYSADPELLQYVDLPHVEGVTTTPVANKHYVASQKHFTFTATYTGAPYKIMATGFYSGKNIELLGEKQDDGSYKYILTYIVEPWTIAIGPDFASDFVDNIIVGAEKPKVWAYNNTLYINAPKEDIISIYSMTGVLHRRMEIPEGNSHLTLERGMYVVTLKDGSVHKVVIR